MTNFLQYKEFIEEGDTVIICRGRDKYVPVVVKRGEVIQVRAGAIHHSSLIGKQYGSKVQTSNGKNWVAMLHPTPELWTQALPHRTQILYATDISVISLQVGLRPGSVVMECGTGSGSLSHAIARTIAPSGHLYTFEFHQQRAEIARKEFASHGLTHIITLEHRDVCRDGFGKKAMADAVFLDLPRPWEAIETAKTAIKFSGGRLCSFSPCIEQVQRTCQQLRELHFIDIEVMESLRRPYGVREHTLSVPHMGTPGTPTPHKLTHPTQSQVTLYTAQPVKTIPGHTGFLTFATLLPRDPQSPPPTPQPATPPATESLLSATQTPPPALQSLLPATQTPPPALQSLLSATQTPPPASQSSPPMNPDSATM